MATKTKTAESTENRVEPQPNAINVMKSFEAMEAGRSLLRSEHQLTSFTSFNALQAAVCKSRNVEILASVLANATEEVKGERKEDLEKITEAAYQDALKAHKAKEKDPADCKRSLEADLRFAKEYVYCRLTLLHLKHVSQYTKLEEYGSAAGFEKRLADLKYMPMSKRWDADGNPVGPGTTPRSGKERRVQGPLILCFRPGTACATAASELIKKGELTKKELRELIPTVYPGFMRGVTKNNLVKVEKDKIILKK